MSSASIFTRFYQSNVAADKRRMTQFLTPGSIKMEIKTL